MKSTKENKCIISEKGGKVCNKVLFSYFAFSLHDVSVNHVSLPPHQLDKRRVLITLKKRKKS